MLKNTEVTSLNGDNLVTDENGSAPSGTVLPSSQARKTVTQVESLGVVTFPTATTFDNTQVGGLSGLTYDVDNNVYYSISDDRSNINPARFYTLTIDLSDGSLDDGDVAFTGVTTLLDANGEAFPANSVDPEAITLTEDGTVYISSEGNANALINPFINEFSLSGAQLAALSIPAYYLPTSDGTTGIRHNLAFESVTITPDGRYLYSATENALNQDGSISTLEDTSLSRIIKYDLTTGEVVAEYVYEVEAIPKEPIPADEFADNGLVELVAIDNNGTLLALERSYSTGVGNTVKLYEVLTQGALDVKGFEDLYREEPLDDDGEIIPPDRFSIDPPVQKRLLVDFEADLGITPDNLEGLAWGPKLADGRQSLIVVSDNNFNDTQTTQFIALALDLNTIPSALPTVETPYTVDDEDGTTPLIGDSDDPAVWIDPVNSNESIIIATLKDGGLALFNLDGTVQQTITPADVLGDGAEYGDIRYNNVDVIYDVELGAETVDIAVASDRENDTLAIFKIDPTSRQLVNITSEELSNEDFSIFGVDDGEATAYGLAAYKSPLTGKDYIFVTQASGNQIAQLELKSDGTGAITAEVVRTLTLPLEEGEDATDFDPSDYQSEAMVVDQEFGTVYVGVEAKLGIVKFAAEPDGGDTISIVRPTGSPELKPDLEGLGLYYGADGTGYLVASSQGDSSYAVYTREGNNTYLGSFIVGDNPALGIDQANETDGLDIVNLPLGSQFPFGALLVHDGANEPQNSVENDDELENNSTNFKFVPWEGVANAFDTPLTIDTESYNPRSPVNRLEPTVSISDGAVIEGLDNQVSVIVKLSAPSDETVTVDYQTIAQTATADQDYSSESGTITFAPGETSQILTIPILDDNISEDFETFVVELFSTEEPPESVADAVIQAVSESQNQPPENFSIQGATEQIWPNSCLGLAQDDEVCLQMLVPGWQVKVTDEEQTWIYRTDGDGTSLRLETVIPYIPLNNPVGATIGDNQGVVTISDVISADTNFTLPSQVENLDLIGNDNLNGKGNANPNYLMGNRGNNTLKGVKGADTLFGGKGDDILLGGTSDDLLRGAKDNDNLVGNQGYDTLRGAEGDDTLNGGAGKDRLFGGLDKDTFVFNSANDLFDQIKDFVPNVDKIALATDGFDGGLTVGNLPETQFVLGSQAQDEDDRLIYNPNTGGLFFDPDGTGEAGKMKVAVLRDKPLLTAQDIILI